MHGSEYEATLANIMEITSCSREEAVAAMRAAFNNPDRAIEYIFSGIPEVPASAAPGGGSPPPAAVGGGGGGGGGGGVVGAGGGGGGGNVGAGMDWAALAQALGQRQQEAPRLYCSLCYAGCDCTRSLSL